MLPLLPLIIAALVGVALTLIVIALLKWKDILAWFRNRRKLKESDKENIAFTLQERLKSGKYKTIRGIFNKNTEEFPDVEQVDSNDIDEKLAKAHAENELVVYE
jgi:hypothetical protein